MGLIDFFLSISNHETAQATVKNVVSVDPIDPISVPFDTDFVDLDLPGTVMATFDVGSPELVNLTWLVGDYDGLWDDTYTIYATITETETVLNPSLVQAEIEVTVQDIPAPNYALATNLKLILDAQGLVSNTTNSYGVVNSSNQVTTWKSLTPGPTGEDFPFNTTALDLYNKIIYGNGDGTLRHATATYFDFMSYKATFSNIKFTIHAEMMFEDIPGGAFGLLGNNGTSAGSKGVAAYFVNNSTTAKALRWMTSKGSAGLILDATQANAVIKYSMHALSIVCDCSLTAADRVKYYIDKVQQTYVVAGASTAVVTTPTYGMEIFGCGNSTVKGVGGISHLIITEDANLNTAFLDTLIPHNLRRTKHTVDRTKTYSATTFLDENSYYLNVAVEKNPVTNKYLVVFGNWTSSGHTWHENNLIAFRTSDDLITFATKATAFSPASTKGALDMGFFFDSTGVGHGFTNTMNGTGSTPTAGTSELWYFKTVDDGANWTNEVLTPPSDGMTFTAAYGNGYTKNGYNFFTVYRQDNTAANSINYILKWAVGANISTVQWIAIRSGTTYMNEATIADGVWLARNESTLEWSQITSDDDWVTFTSPVDVTFGETNTTAGPARMREIEIEGVPCFMCLYPLRGTAVLKMIFAKKAGFSGLGASAWISGTKVTIVDDTEIIHYGGFCNYNGNMNAFAVYTREEAADATSNLISFHIPTTAYTTIRTALGITLIGT